MMFVVKVEEKTDPDYKVKSKELAFPTQEKAESFIFDQSKKENHRIFIVLSICFLIFISVYAACVFSSVENNLHKISMKLSK